MDNRCGGFLIGQTGCRRVPRRQAGGFEGGNIFGAKRRYVTPTAPHSSLLRPMRRLILTPMKRAASVRIPSSLEEWCWCCTAGARSRA